MLMIFYRLVKILKKVVNLLEKEEFEVKYFDKMKDFFGMKVEGKENGVSVSIPQAEIIGKIFKEFNMMECKQKVWKSAKKMIRYIKEKKDLACLLDR